MNDTKCKYQTLMNIANDLTSDTKEALSYFLKLVDFCNLTEGKNQLSEVQRREAIKFVLDGSGRT